MGQIGFLWLSKLMKIKKNHIYDKLRSTQKEQNLDSKLNNARSTQHVIQVFAAQVHILKLLIRQMTIWQPFQLFRHTNDAHLSNCFILETNACIFIITSRARLWLSHCCFTILNHRKKGPVQFCHSALLRIHRTLEQKYFLKSRKGLLR